MAKDTTIKGPGGGGDGRPATSPAPYSGFGLGPPIMPSAEETAQAIQWYEQEIYYGGGSSFVPSQNTNTQSRFSSLILLGVLIMILK